MKLTNRSDALRNIAERQEAGPFNHLFEAYRSCREGLNPSSSDLKEVTLPIDSVLGRGCWKKEVYVPWRIAREIRNATLGTSQSK